MNKDEKRAVRLSFKLAKELISLDHKQFKIRRFMKSKKYQGLSPEARGLLTKQYAAMNDYRNVLNQRRKLIAWEEFKVDLDEN